MVQNTDDDWENENIQKLITLYINYTLRNKCF